MQYKEKIDRLEDALKKMFHVNTQNKTEIALREAEIKRLDKIVQSKSMNNLNSPENIGEMLQNKENSKLEQAAECFEMEQQKYLEKLADMQRQYDILTQEVPESANNQE